MKNKTSIFTFWGLLLSLCLIAIIPTLSSAESDAAGELSVHITPTRFGVTSMRSIELGDPTRHFYVVVTNTGKTSVRLWREWCSFGYYNLSFMMKNQHGTVVNIVKRPIGWDKNYPDWTTVVPGESMVYEVTFDKSTWNESSLPKAGTSENIDLSAVFDIPGSPEAKKNGVWSGRITSPTNTYTLSR